MGLHNELFQVISQTLKCTQNILHFGWENFCWTLTLWLSFYPHPLITVCYRIIFCLRVESNANIQQYEKVHSVPSPRGGVGVLVLSKKAASPQIELWSIANRCSFYQISEWHAPWTNVKPSYWKPCSGCGFTAQPNRKTTQYKLSKRVICVDIK